MFPNLLISVYKKYWWKVKTINKWKYEYNKQENVKYWKETSNEN